MTFIWLIVLLLSGRYLLKKCKIDSKSRRIITNKTIKVTTQQEREDDFHSLMGKIRGNQKNEGTKERDKEFINPTEQIYAQQVKELLKPGYQNDPEWQVLSKRLKETAKHNAEVEEFNFAGME